MSYTQQDFFSSFYCKQALSVDELIKQMEAQPPSSIALRRIIETEKSQRDRNEIQIEFKSGF